MKITGERTVPGVVEENYWFRRHEVCYRLLRRSVRGRRVLEAGCGEGYGAYLLAAAGADVVPVDYDTHTTDHVRATYPGMPVVQGNLVSLPFADASFDLVVSLQTVEHLWDQPGFVRECVRVLRAGGRLVLSTPNRHTFPSGNIFHTRELDARELDDLVSPYAEVTRLSGLRHGPRLRAWEENHGDLVSLQLERPPADWSTDLVRLVSAVRASDFELRDEGTADCLDLWLVGLRP